MNMLFFIINFTFFFFWGGGQAVVILNIQLRKGCKIQKSGKLYQYTMISV